MGSDAGMRGIARSLDGRSGAVEVAPGCEAVEVPAGRDRGYIFAAAIFLTLVSQGDYMTLGAPAGRGDYGDLFLGV